jgi:DNA-binding response OmpR family regulator
MDSPLNVVVVEDHDALREMTVQALRDLQCNAVGVSSAEEVDEVASPLVDIFVINLNLPGEDGISLSKRIRHTHPRAGIIMVSARAKAEEKLIGYDSGADFYLAKPTSVEELGAVIQAFRRRLKDSREATRQGFVLYAARLRLIGPAAPADGIPLTGNEVVLLTALARANENRLEFWQLIKQASRTDTETKKSTFAVQVVRLRKKLELAGAPEDAIKALRGFGYQLCIPLTVL